VLFAPTAAGEDADPLSRYTVESMLAMDRGRVLAKYGSTTGAFRKREERLPRLERRPHGGQGRIP
jgi:hypothetical protein